MTEPLVAKYILQGPVEGSLKVQACYHFITVEKSGERRVLYTPQTPIGGFRAAAASPTRLVLARCYRVPLRRNTLL